MIGVIHPASAVRAPSVPSAAGERTTIALFIVWDTGKNIYITLDNRRFDGWHARPANGHATHAYTFTQQPFHAEKFDKISHDKNTYYFSNKSSTYRIERWMGHIRCVIHGIVPRDFLNLRKQFDFFQKKTTSLT